MIIAPDWIWMHFPKCAGSATERTLRAAFAEDPEVQLDESHPVISHDNLAQRAQRDPGFSAEGRVVICNIRRLPHWLLSRVHFGATVPSPHIATRDLIERGAFIQDIRGEPVVRTADFVAGRYAKPRVDHWIRSEHLEEDLGRTFGALGHSLTFPETRVNVTRIDYIREVDFWFTREQLERLYACNPIWSEVERKVYGATLAEEKQAA